MTAAQQEYTQHGDDDTGNEGRGLDIPHMHDDEWGRGGDACPLVHDTRVPMGTIVGIPHIAWLVGGRNVECRLQVGVHTTSFGEDARRCAVCNIHLEATIVGDTIIIIHFLFPRTTATPDVIAPLITCGLNASVCIAVRAYYGGIDCENREQAADHLRMRMMYNI